MSKKSFLGEPENHPSFGAVTLSRISSNNGASLYQSRIKHRNFIRLRIFKAQNFRNLYTDVSHTTKSVVEVDMTANQFSQLITTMGLSEGVPCTIRRIDGETIPEPLFDSRREQFVKEFHEQMEDISHKCDEVIGFVKELMEKTSVSKADRTALLHQLTMLKQDIGQNTPFIAKQFNEQMEDVLNDVKSEVQEFIGSMAQQTGLQAIQKQLPSFE